MKRSIRLNVNGVDYDAFVEPRALLVHVLREDLDLTGTKIGCEVGKCGACTVMMDGKAVKSCMVLGIQAEESQLLTVEGLSTNGKMHAVQEAFWEDHGLQCGYCTPGMVMSAYALLEKKSDVTDDEIKEALAGNLCTCTGYQNIVKAVRDASKKMQVVRR